MEVKTSYGWCEVCCPADLVIGIKLTETELVEKKEIFGNWGGEEHYYFGDTARVIYYYFFQI